MRFLYQSKRLLQLFFLPLWFCTFCLRLEMGFEFLFRGFSCFWGKHALRKEEIPKESIGDLDGFVFLKKLCKMTKVASAYFASYRQRISLRVESGIMQAGLRVRLPCWKAALPSCLYRWMRRLTVLKVQPRVTAARFLFPFVSTNFLITSYFTCSFILSSTFLILTTSEEIVYTSS